MATKTRAERETIICRAQDESSWHVFSEDPRIVRKLTRLHGAGKPKGQGWVWLVHPGGIVFRGKGSALASGSRKPNDGLARWRAEQAKGSP